MKVFDRSAATNWSFLMVVIMLGIFVGAGIVWYSFFVPTGLEKYIELSITHIPKVEKIVYTKVIYDSSIGRARSLRIAHVDGTAREILINDIPNDPLNEPRFLLIPERSRVVLIGQERTFPYEIKVEKIQLETGNRTELGTYRQGEYGAALGDAVLSPDKKKIAFTSSRTLLVADVREPVRGPIAPLYTLEEGHQGGSLGIDSWDSEGNIYLKVLTDRFGNNLLGSGFIKVTPQGEGVEVEEIEDRIAEGIEPPLHAVEISGKGSRDITDAELYIDGIALDSIGDISVTFGHGPAFEVLGFVHGRVLEGWERDEQETKEAEIRRFLQTAFYPTYIPKGWIEESESSSAPAAVITRFAKGRNTFTILQRKIETPYLVELVPISEYPASQYSDDKINSVENITIEGNKGIHLIVHDTQQQLLWDTDEFRTIIYCFQRDGCTFPKAELIKIAESMEPVWSLENYK